MAERQRRSTDTTAHDSDNNETDECKDNSHYPLHTTVQASAPTVESKYEKQKKRSRWGEKVEAAHHGRSHFDATGSWNTNDNMARHSEWNGEAHDDLALKGNSASRDSVASVQEDWIKENEKKPPWGNTIRNNDITTTEKDLHPKNALKKTYGTDGVNELESEQQQETVLVSASTDNRPLHQKTEAPSCAAVAVDRTTMVDEEPSKKKKKKPRWGKEKKQEAEMARQQQQQAEKPPLQSTLANKPGKKQMRRLRYQQKISSPASFLMFLAKTAAFTNSVAVVEAKEEGESNTNQTTASQSSATTPIKRLQIETTGNLLPKESNHFGNCDTSTPLPTLATLSSITVQPLLVLDLNGILCHRVRGSYREVPINSTLSTNNSIAYSYRPSIAQLALTPIIPRPDLTEFLTFLDRHFCLGVWTSAKTKTAQALVKVLFPPSVASRLLFVWTQQHCNMIVRPKGNVPATAQESNGDHVGKSHCESDSEADGENGEVIFEKDLSKVWKEFPLWNAQNTLLMDDSPDKCTQWHKNAVHPPPLNGHAEAWILENRKTQSLSSPSLITDHENQRRQLVFYNGLVKFWREHSVIQIWDETTGNTPLSTNVCRRSAQREQPSWGLEEVEDDGMERYLSKHAVEHMGWK